MYLLSSVPHVCTLIAPPAAAFFMRVSIWLSFQVACGTLVLGSILVWLMPESLKHQPAKKDDHVLPVEIFAPLDEDEEPLIAEDQPHESISGSTIVPSNDLTWWEEIKELFEIPGLRFCFALFFVVPIALISKAYVYQVCSLDIVRLHRLTQKYSTLPKSSIGPTLLPPGSEFLKPAVPLLLRSSPSLP